MRILLLVNPRSRSGAAARRIPDVLQALEAAGADVTCLEVGPTTTADVAQLAGGFERVVALGGDGTFACGANGVLDSGADVPLALLPAGLANNHARGFGIPTIYDDLPGAVEQVFGTGRVQMDVGRLDGQRFYDTVGFGFQASALVRREGLRHRPGLSGELGYAVGTVLEMARQRGAATAGVTVEVDGESVRWERVLDVVVSNSIWYGGRWILDERARADDGVLEVVAVRGWRDLVRHGLTVVGTADRQGASIALAFDRPVHTQVDGEIGPVRQRFSLDVVPGALAVVAE
jgi:diacylglycerol kinase (ATP)